MPLQAEVLSGQNFGEFAPLPHAEEGFNMEAFRLDHEHKNFHEKRTVTREGVIEQLRSFVGEYLTNMHEFQYEYRFDINGNLVHPNWTKPVREIYANAVNEPGTEISDRTRQIRRAEELSFSTIENLMKSSATAKAILQSPKENYPGSEHSFVSFYEMAPQYFQDEHGAVNIEYKVKVRNRRIYHCGADVHNAVRRTWGTKIDRIYRDVELSPVEILANAIPVPEDITFEQLMQDYGDFAYMAKNDKKIKEQMDEFMPEIETFFNIFSDPRNINYKESEQKLVQAFKILLVKAKVHFNEEEARKRWPDNGIVDQIKASMQTSQMTTELSNQIMQLPILLIGSCGSVGGNISDITKLTTVGLASIGEMTKALYTFTIPGRKSSIQSALRPDESICSCGCKWYVDNKNPETYEPSCPNPKCTQDKRCK